MAPTSTIPIEVRKLSWARLWQRLLADPAALAPTPDDGDLDDDAADDEAA